MFVFERNWMWRKCGHGRANRRRASRSCRMTQYSQSGSLCHIFNAIIRPNYYAQGNPYKFCKSSAAVIAVNMADSDVSTNESRSLNFIIIPLNGSMGILSLLCVILFVILFVSLYGYGFLSGGKNTGVKFCMCVGLLSGQVFSPLVNMDIQNWRRRH